MTRPAPKALAQWAELNDRQQGTLAVIFELDQEVEADRRVRAAQRRFDDTPAAVWRRIDFAHDAPTPPIKASQLSTT